MTKEEIKKIRLDLGMTQQMFAEKFPKSLPTISKWENGHTSPSRLDIDRLKAMKEGR